MRLALAAVLILGSGGMAFAQVTPSMEMSTNKNCKGGITEPQARYAADAAGYEPANNIMQDKDCNWMGENATKGTYMIDGKTGKVTGTK